MPDDPEAPMSEQVTNNPDNVNGLALSPSQGKGPTENVTTDIQHDALSITEAAPKEHGSDLNQTLQSDTGDAPGNINSSVSDNDGDAKDADGHVDPTKHSAEEESNAEQDPFTDDEDGWDGEDGSDIGSAFPEPEGPEDDGAIARPVRYELSYWPHHLQAAEKLWTPEERLNNHDWKELWNLILNLPLNTVLGSFDFC